MLGRAYRQLPEGHAARPQARRPVRRLPGQGHAIQQFSPRGGYVDLDGERFDIRAKVTSIGGYSAHADQNGLVEFVTGMREWSREIRVVHGEEGAKH